MTTGNPTGSGSTASRRAPPTASKTGTPAAWGRAAVERASPAVAGRGHRGPGARSRPGPRCRRCPGAELRGAGTARLRRPGRDPAGQRPEPPRVSARAGSLPAQMSTEAHPRLLRDRDGGWIAGVCAGIAQRFGIDVALVRLAFIVLTAAGGAGVAVYILAWLVVPAGGTATRRRRLPTGRGAVEVALGTGLLLLSALLTSRALGIWFSDAIVWPLVLVVSGAALLWRQSLAGPAPTQSPAPAAEPRAAARAPEAA